MIYGVISGKNYSVMRADLQLFLVSLQLARVLPLSRKESRLLLDENQAVFTSKSPHLSRSSRATANLREGGRCKCCGRRGILIHHTSLCHDS